MAEAANASGEERSGSRAPWIVGGLLGTGLVIGGAVFLATDRESVDIGACEDGQSSGEVVDGGYVSTLLDARETYGVWVDSDTMVRPNIVDQPGEVACDNDGVLELTNEGVALRGAVHTAIDGAARDAIAALEQADQFELQITGEVDR